MRSIAACILLSLQLIADPGAHAVHHIRQHRHTLHAHPQVAHADGNTLDKRGGIANGITLRILPLGASIVYGQTSNDGNGFRYALRNRLVYDSNPVNMIGSVQQGTMTDNECEGWPGYTITQVASKAELSIPSQPNLILLHVGTNDAVQSVDIGNAANRLGSLIDRLFAAIPDVTIIASTLLANGNSVTQANIKTYNSQIPDIIRARQSAGKKLTYVDFSSSYFSVADLGPDGLLIRLQQVTSRWRKSGIVSYAAPTIIRDSLTEGVEGIKVVDAQGWLNSPNTVSGVSDAVSTASGRTCNKVPGASIGPTQTQMGSGSDDGAYHHVGTQVDGFAGFINPSTVNFNNPLPEGVFWADIDGDGIDDYVYVGSNSNYGLGVALSLGGGKFGSYLYYTFSPSCNRPGVRFADMTGDGRDDFCCLGPDGGLLCWQNTKGSDSRSPNWVSMGTVKASEGYPQAQVRLADIDGDGRADYVVFDASTSNIYGWRNGALSNGAPAYWYAMQGVFSGLPAHALSGWRFVDLNGDKKDDLIWVDANGQVISDSDRNGYPMGEKPSACITHGGSGTPVNVTFGTFMGSGRADYALGSIKNGNVYVNRWENHDYGGTMVRGDGARYCDMTGSGSDDYLFIDSTGAITLFENQHNWGYWVPWGVIYSTNRKRQEVHLADFDGDGKCDILLVDKSSGSTTVLQNRFASGKFSFVSLGVVTGSATCTEGYGTDKHDLGVRWNDIDGDGRADFLCVTPDGVVSGYLNKGVNSMINQGMIKHTEGKERKNLRLADINGDGRDDFLFVDMLNGSVTEWQNGGAIPSSGSAFQWNWQDVVSPGGSCRGQCVEFGALYGLGRADYIIVDPSTNKAWTWFNVCPGGLGPTTPNLPSGAPPAPTVGSVQQSSSTVSASRTSTISSPSSTASNTVDNDDNLANDDSPSCDYTLTWNNLDDLGAVADGLDEYCLAIYTLATLITMFDTAYDNYTAVNTDYDSQFGYYVTYMIKLIPSVLDNQFMFDQSSTTEQHHIPVPGPGMNFFSCHNVKSDPQDFPCSDLETLARTSDHLVQAPVVLTLADQDGYNGGLLEAGISPDWTILGDHEIVKEVSEPRAGRKYVYEFEGYPIEDPQVVIPNPKDIVTQGLGDLSELRTSMQATLMDLILGQFFDGDTSDAAEAYSTPVFMLMQATDGMAQAKVLAAQEMQDEKEEAQRKKNFILLIVSVILMFIPIVGEEIAAAAGFATLARAIAIAGEVGNAALGVYDTVNDPSSAVVNILGMLVGVGAIAKVSRDGKGIGDVANLRRE
nr:hypothetical protein B0A51_05021 [Rachicladosporium sp. CCFEE 5018]